MFNEAGTVLIANSTLDSNSAVGGNAALAVGGNGVGGGVFNLDGTVTLINDTFANNTVFGGAGTTDGTAAGAGLFNLALSLPSDLASETALGRYIRELLAMGRWREICIQPTRDEPHECFDVYGVAAETGPLRP